MTVLGIDIGTSGCRAAAFDHSLREIAGASQTYSVHVPSPGRAELDPNTVLDKVAACIRAVNSQLAAGQRVTGVSVASQGEAVIPVDRHLRPLAPAPVSADMRGADAVARMADKLGIEQIRRTTGQPVHPMFSAGKIAAWSGEPRVWSHVARIHTFADLVTTWLGGDAVIDYTLAARTLLFDTVARRWAADLLDAAGVDDRLLPTPVAVGTEIGRVSTERSSDLGFGHRPLIYAGGHDQACAFWGAGGTVSEPVFSLGTTECLTSLSTERPAQLIDLNVASYPVDDASEWLSLTGIPSGGSTLQWLANLTGFGTEHIAALVSGIGDQPSPVLLLPYLAGSGTLDNNPGSRGALIGLTLQTRPQELVAALFEASGFELAADLAFLEQTRPTPRAVRAVGGSARGPALQLRANAAGRALTPVPGSAAARGAAVLTLWGAGALSTRTEAHDLIAVAERITPSPLHQDHYRLRRTEFASLRQFAAALSAMPTERTTP